MKLKLIVKQSLIITTILLVSCDPNENLTEDQKTLSEDDIDGTCGLTKVYHDQKLRLDNVLFIETGITSDTVFYYNYSDSSLINYTLFEYDDKGNVIEKKIYDPQNNLESIEVTEYWENGKKKNKNYTRIKQENSNDFIYAHKDYKYDEHGNVTEFLQSDPNYSIEVYHYTYINTYENDLIVKAIKTDLAHGGQFSGILEYSYNPSGLISSSVLNDYLGNLVARNEYNYNDSDFLEESIVYFDTGLYQKINYDLNINGVILNTKIENSDGELWVENHFYYSCD